MALIKPRTQYGIHSMTAVSRTTGLPYGILKVLKGASTSATRDSVDLFGGSNPHPIATEFGNITNEITLTFSEFKPFLFELAGYDKTVNAAEATGSVSTLTNKNGLTLSSTGGISAIALSTGTGGAGVDLKDGEYVIVATTSSAVDVYAITDIAATVGTDLTINDNLAGTNVLKITTGAITISATAADIPSMGLKITGVAAPAMTAGDTATFTVRSANAGSYQYKFGENPVPIEFGMYLYSQRTAEGEYSMDYYPRVKFGAVPLARNEKAWTETALPIKVINDPVFGGSSLHKDLVKSI